MFHRLRVASVERLTDDAVAVTFEVPPHLRPSFRHTPGQHLTLRLPPATSTVTATTEVDVEADAAAANTGGGGGSGEEIRRTYSICSPSHADAAPRVGIRLVEGGVFSTYAWKELAAGDLLDVMEPSGRFVLTPRPGHFAAVVGGSGITPVLSMAATLLSAEPDARFTLVRSDRTSGSTMFLDEVADLKDRHPDRFHLVHVLSREEQQAGPASGRLDEERLRGLLPALLPIAAVEGWYLCGPYGLVQAAEGALLALGVARDRVHEEIFHAEAAPIPEATTSGTARATGGTVTATLHGRSDTWPWEDGDTLLDTVLRRRLDAPYACRGGVCGTCRTFLVSGSVHMDRDFALEPGESAAGYVLACQSRPTSEHVEVDFDR